MIILVVPFSSLFSSLAEKWFSRFELNQEVRLIPGAETRRMPIIHEVTPWIKDFLCYDSKCFSSHQCIHEDYSAESLSAEILVMVPTDHL